MLSPCSRQSRFPPPFPPGCQRAVYPPCSAVVYLRLCGGPSTAACLRTPEAEKGRERPTRAAGVPVLGGGPVQAPTLLRGKTVPEWGLGCSSCTVGNRAAPGLLPLPWEMQVCVFPPGCQLGWLHSPAAPAPALMFTSDAAAGTECPGIVLPVHLGSCSRSPPCVVTQLLAAAPPFCARKHMGETSCRAGPWVTALGEPGSCLWRNKDT